MEGLVRLVVPPEGLLIPRFWVRCALMDGSRSSMIMMGWRVRDEALQEDGRLILTLDWMRIKVNMKTKTQHRIHKMINGLVYKWKRSWSMRRSSWRIIGLVGGDWLRFDDMV